MTCPSPYSFLTFSLCSLKVMDPWMDFTRRKQFLVNKWEILALTSSFFIFNVGAKIVLLTNHTFDLTARLYFFDFYCNKSGDEVKGTLSPSPWNNNKTNKQILGWGLIFNRERCRKLSLWNWNQTRVSFLLLFQFLQ